MTDLLYKAQENLHAQGGRMTNQRRLILETLEEMTDHPTAEEVYALAHEQDPSLNLSTVYRTLRWLQTENLVQSRFFQETRHPERFDPSVAEEHDHFICTTCRRVIEFDNRLVESIKTEFENESGAQVSSGSIIFYGQCPDCMRRFPE